MRVAIFVLLGGLLCGPPAQAQGGNLLLNGDFDGFDGWILRTGMSALDTDRSHTPGSNSLLLSKTDPGVGRVVQYVPADAGRDYVIDGCFMIDSFDNGGAEGIAQLGALFTTSPCNGGGTILSGEALTPVISGPADTWTCVAPVPFQTPPGTECIEYTVFVRNDTADATFGVNFDDLQLTVPEPGAAPAMLAAVATLARLALRRRSRSIERSPAES